MEMCTIKQMANLWNISERRVSYLCQSGKIEGAIKEGRAWKIPKNTKKAM